jgi:hypothetical protein
LDIPTFLIAVFCLLEDVLVGKRLRERGPRPTLRASKVYMNGVWLLAHLDLKPEYQVRWPVQES